MKKYALAIGIITMVIVCLGQTSKSDSSKFKHEISIVVEDFLKKSDFPINYYDYGRYDYVYYNQYNNEVGTTKVGLGYRLHFNKYAIRARVLYNSNNNSNSGNENGSSSNSFMNLSSYIGIERHVDIKKAQFLYGLDFGLIKMKNDWNYDDYTMSNNDYSSKMNYTSFVVSPLLGFKYHFHPAISISTELRFNIERHYTEWDYDYERNENDQNQKSDGLRTEIGPVGFLSLNFHF